MATLPRVDLHLEDGGGCARASVVTTAVFGSGSGQLQKRFPPKKFMI